MATNTMKKLPRVKPKTYTTCLLYKTKEAREKLKGISLAACNPKFEKKDVCEETEQGKGIYIQSSDRVIALNPFSSLLNLTLNQQYSILVFDV